MMVKRVSVVGLAAVATFVIASAISPHSAQAISIGVRQGDGMVCRVALWRPHIHVGEGHTEASKPAAMASAIVNWSAFTKLEYGRRWGNWRIARRKVVNCTGGGSAWRCILKAQPCKMDVVSTGRLSR